MPHEVWLDTERTLLRVLFASNATIEDWKRALEQVEYLAEETGIRCVLFDVRTQTDIASASERYDFASHLPCTIAFAVLCELYLAEHRFIEVVASGRGAVVKNFNSEQDAIQWLESWSSQNA